MTSTLQHGQIVERPVRVANCSGYRGDPAEEMYRQATLGDVDFITGDYLAEANLAAYASAFAAGDHPGYYETAWEGLKQSIEVISAKGIKVVINGGALNPRGLAQKTARLVKERNLGLVVSYISGDNVLESAAAHAPAFDPSGCPRLDYNTKGHGFEGVGGAGKLHDSQGNRFPLVSAHAYLGARGIVAALRGGADIVICGRVSDASPVIGAAWYWHGWKEDEYERLAGSLMAGHLIECSAYVTGGNLPTFAAESGYDMDQLLQPGFPIAEIAEDGTCVITKHQRTGGFVDIDTVKSQLVYELQGSTYLHSDCKAILDNVQVRQLGPNRVGVSGVQGRPPTSTTKVAAYYKGGFELQILANANGYEVERKCDLFEKQLRFHVGEDGLALLQVLEVQRIGMPAVNPPNQNASTMYIRVYAASQSREALSIVPQAFSRIGLGHFPGFHLSLDMRTAQPRPILTYYPVLWKQEYLNERAHILHPDGGDKCVLDAGHPSSHEDLPKRDSYETSSPRESPGPSRVVRLGDVALARSGDKGGNINIGIFVDSVERWNWLRSYLTCSRMQALVGRDWKDSFAIERVELAGIYAVHFVIYGILGAGVCDSPRLDNLGKGFAEYIRDKLVDVPSVLL